MLTTLAISGYRSLRNVVLPLRALNVITGPAACGMTGIYRALRLLADLAHGHATESLAAEGGLAATAWAGADAGAGPRYDHTVENLLDGQLRLGFATTELRYAVDLGMAAAGDEPEIKVETIWRGPTLTEQRGVKPADSLLARPDQKLGGTLRAWLFPFWGEIPKLAPALQAARNLDAAVSDAFPGSRVAVENGEVKFYENGLRRPLELCELSSGTYWYLQWIGALLTPEPHPLVALHGPTTGFHPDLLPAFARLIAKAATRTQMVVVTHSPQLIASLDQKPECHLIELEKNFGETIIDNLEEEPAWHWPGR